MEQIEFRDAGTPDSNFFNSIIHAFLVSSVGRRGMAFVETSIHLGKYVVKILDGKPSEEEKGTWHRDSNMDEVKREKPREVQDIQGYSDEPVSDAGKQGPWIMI